MKNFVEANPNPAGRLTTDCVIRAICYATSKDWKGVLQHLADYAKETGEIKLNNRLNFSPLLIELGFTEVVVNERMTVNQLSNKFSGVAVALTRNHMVCVKQGNYWDTWDSGRCTVLSYWKKESE